MIRLLFLLLWLGWAVYWWWSARDVKATLRREGAGSRLAHVVPLLVAALLLALPSVPGLDGRLWSQGYAVAWLGAGLAAAGLGFAVWARRVLGRNWSGSVTIKAGHELVTAGPYRLVRHPIYSGLLLAMLGGAVSRGEWRGVLAVLIAAAALWRKLRLEERWMAATFGEAYARFRRRRAALVPFVL